MKYYNTGYSKKLIVFFFLLCGLITAQAQQKYTVKGNIEGVTTEMKVFLQYRVDREFINDSVITKNGTFNFTGTLTRPVKAVLLLLPTIRTKGFQADSRKFYLSSGHTSVSGNSLKAAVIKGGKPQDDYMELATKTDPLQDSVDQYTWKSIGAGKDRRAAMQAKLDTFNLMLDQVQLDFMAKHPDSYVSLDLVASKAYVITDPGKFENMYNKLSATLKKTTEGKKYAQLLYLTRKLAVGQPAIDFTQKNPDGKPVSLAALKGKYVLVDFWASWCGPCRVEYPYLKQAYSLFKDKNFEIIGVSLDDNSSAWIKSIQDNGFLWPQICDLKGFKNEVATTYGVIAIPQSFLIDTNGIIIAKNLRGNNLIDKLKEIIQ